MASPTLLSQHGLRIAVEGCGHGVLHEIYASVAKACELKGWPGVDLLIIGGDFQVCLSLSARLPHTDLQGCAQRIRSEGSLHAS
jgi:lariat debranching enzyme